MNQDQKGRIDNLFRSILVFHGQFVRQRDLGSIDDDLQVEIGRLGMSINRLYPELTNMGIAELVRPLLRLLDYFNTYSQDQTLSLFEAIKSSSSYR